MSAEGASSKNFTTSARAATLLQAPADDAHQIPPTHAAQQHQILDLFASDYCRNFEVTWSVYQNITRRLSRPQQKTAVVSRYKPK